MGQEKQSKAGELSTGHTSHGEGKSHHQGWEVTTGSNHVPGQEQPGKGTSLTFHIRQRANVTLRFVELRGHS